MSKKKMSDEMRQGMRVRHARIAAGLTQVELAERAGLAQQTISHLERGINARSSYIDSIASALGLTVEQLVGSEWDESGLLVRRAPKMVSVKIYDSDAALLLPVDVLEGLTAEAEHLVAMRASDDAMAPFLRKDDWLVLDTSRTVLRAGSVYGIETATGVQFRRVQAKLDGSVQVTADGQVNATEELTPAQARKLKVLGLVVWTCGRV